MAIRYCHVYFISIITIIILLKDNFQDATPGSKAH